LLLVHYFRELQGVVVSSFIEAK